MNKRTLNLLMILILWGVSFYTLYVTIFTNIVIGLQNYIGFGLLSVLTLLWFLKIKRFNTIFALFLLLGSFNVFQFTYSTITIGSSISFSGIKFITLGVQPLCSLLLLLFVVVYKSQVRVVVQKLLGTDQESLDENESELVHHFYKQLQSKTISELHSIVKEPDSFQPACVDAAKKIIEERESQKD
ncbi:hypothetical protein EYV94_13625 [Puteibacter caeruleilacunae]|nr:hypothetical protein EYV94_13625 [Puteibacter caeruleilacunae]